MIAILLLLADPPPIVASRGDDLASFEVVVDVARVAHESPRALAESYAAFDAATVNDVEARFARLFKEAHLDVLRRYYDGQVVAAQAAAYEEAGAPPRVAHAVLSDEAREGGGALVTLERTVGAGPGAATQRLRLAMRREGKWWWLDAIEQAGPDGVVARRDLGLPPVLPIPAVPPEEAPQLGTPSAALRSLQRDMARLLALRARAQGALYGKYLDLIRAFYGDEAAERARREQRRAEPGWKLEYEYGPPEGPREGPLRVEVWAFEVVPGTKGRRSAVGTAAFRMKRDALEAWRIVEEGRRPKPDAPAEPIATGFGLFFLR
jgi:hypothetical protein